MISEKACKVAVEPILVKKDTSYGEIKDKIKDDFVPIFLTKENKVVGVINAKDIKKLSKKQKVAEYAKEVEVISGSLPLYEVASYLLKYDVFSIPVLCDKKIKAISAKTILHSIKETKPLAKRPAKTIMSPITAIKENNQDSAGESAIAQMVDAVPIVNESGKLIAVWMNGKINKRPSVVRENTRVKLVVDKVLKNLAVVVIDKHREPKGIISVKELLSLAATYREVNVPTLYDGLEQLSSFNEADLRSKITELLNKVSQIVPINYAVIRINKRGVWKISIRISTKWRMYMASREGENFHKLIDEVCKVIEREVKEDKEKRKKLRI